ncbi:mannose-6-phosphate isomerase [Cimex lectularius]|uniref:mannose-6-phosphate isomerase n=1 Tax=Cimex lectularius TaxID=79782 RepID=A0A8I6TB09_CIMLE|nr:mannose-6-phosphate isomerase [Cimex lectularius]
MELACVAQLYDWGKLGSSSLVSRLLSSNKNFKLDENIPYAELWIGTHAKGESCMLSTGETLHSYLKRNPRALGSVLDDDLPFLLKVLSIRKALSIQAHPDKELAAVLHEQNPLIYRDANHKPELAIAVDDFEVLCGFRPLEEIKNFLKLIHELQDIIPINVYQGFIRNANPSSLQAVFTSLMTASEYSVRGSLTNLMNRLKTSVDEIRDAQLYPILEMLQEQHPMDVGIFSIYFMNYIKLKPGEAVFIDANVPHAYLKGNCVEIMACSDNVVRAGLTTKYRDVDTLCMMLNYKSSTASEMMFKGKRIDEYCTVYKPPVKEFSITRIFAPPSKEHVVKSNQSCSIIVIVQGTGNCPQLDIHPGTVAFLPARTELTILTTTHMLLFQAFCLI